MPDRRTGKPTGRPSKLHDVARVDNEGVRHTVADEIVRYLRAGNYVETAAALAHVSKETIYGWLRRGADARAKEIKGREKLTRTEQDHAAFLDAVDEAMAVSEARDLARLAQIADGGMEVKTTTRKTRNGRVVEQTDKIETLLPNPMVLTWRLERRFPDRWGRRRLELTGGQGPDGQPLPIDMRVEGLVDKVRQLRGRRDAVEGPEDGEELKEG